MNASEWAAYCEELRAIIQRVSEFVALCDEGFLGSRTHSADPESTVQQGRHLKKNLCVLLAELRSKLRSRRKEKHQLIRFLHAHLLTTPQRHSPINSALTDVGVALETQFKLSAGAAGSAGYEGGQWVSARLDFKGENGQLLKVLLDESIYTTGLLQDIAASASELFFVTPTSRPELARYTASAQEPGFTYDIVRLGDLLQRIRMEARFSRVEFQEIMELRRVIFDDLWGKFSRLRKEIERYVVSLPSAIQDAVQWANEMLERIGFPNVWTFDPHNLHKHQRAGDELFGAKDPKWNVLVDPQLLKEVLRNILYNAHHGFRGYLLPAGRSWSDLVAIRLGRESRLSPEVDSLEFIVIEIRSRGVPLSESALQRAIENSTFAQHRLQIEEFGGSLSLRSAGSEMGAVVELALLSRAHVSDRRSKEGDTK